MDLQCYVETCWKMLGLCCLSLSFSLWSYVGCSHPLGLWPSEVPGSELLSKLWAARLLHKSLASEYTHDPHHFANYHGTKTHVPKRLKHCQLQSSQPVCLLGEGTNTFFSRGDSSHDSHPKNPFRSASYKRTSCKARARRKLPAKRSKATQEGPPDPPKPPTNRKPWKTWTNFPFFLPQQPTSGFFMVSQISCCWYFLMVLGPPAFLHTQKAQAPVQAIQVWSLSKQFILFAKDYAARTAEETEEEGTYDSWHVKIEPRKISKQVLEDAA